MTGDYPRGLLATGAAYLAGAPRSWGPPIFFGVETLNTCNLSCVYCPQSRPAEHLAKGRGRMTLAQFDTILDRLQAAFPIRRLALHRDGEPLLNPDLESYIRHATGRGIAVSFSTNATLLDGERARRLLDAGLCGVNSDFCADPGTYEARRAGATWSRTREGLEQLLEEADRRGARFHLLIKDIGAAGPGTPATRAALDATRGLFRAHPGRVTVIAARFHNALGGSLQDLSGLSSEGRRARYSLCHQPWVNMTIDWSGRVVACCRDLRSEYVAGNALQEDPREIWNGARMKALRLALARKRPGEIPVCRACDLPWRGSYAGRTPLGRLGNFLFSRVWRARY